MTTVAQMKKLAAPLLARHPDLAMVRRTLVLRPVTHVLRVIELDQSLGRDTFMPSWGMTYLFRPRAAMSLQWFRRILPPAHVNWSLADQNCPDALLQRIETEVLPILRAVETFQDFLDFTCTPVTPYGAWHGSPLTRCVIQAALGELTEARETCARLKQQLDRLSDPLAQTEYIPIVHDLYPLLIKEDRADIARLLHQWECATAETFKLTPYWQPTPFPIEQTG